MPLQVTRGAFAKLLALPALLASPNREVAKGGIAGTSDKPSNKGIRDQSWLNMQKPKGSTVTHLAPGKGSNGQMSSVAFCGVRRPLGWHQMTVSPGPIRDGSRYGPAAPTVCLEVHWKSDASGGATWTWSAPCGSPGTMTVPSWKQAVPPAPRTLGTSLLPASIFMLHIWALFWGISQLLVSALLCNLLLSPLLFPVQEVCGHDGTEPMPPAGIDPRVK